MKLDGVMSSSHALAISSAYKLVVFSGPHLAATVLLSMAAVYTDAAHIADGVIGLKQRSLAASDPTE